jgi:hypothetical protein
VTARKLESGEAVVGIALIAEQQRGAWRVKPKEFIKGRNN